MQTRKAYIIAAARTAIGNFGQAFSETPGPSLAGDVIRSLLSRAPFDKGKVDEVILGNVLQAGVGMNPARQAAVHGGIPYEVPAYTVNMVCASGLQAIALGAQAVQSGRASGVVAGGFESMSLSPRAVLRSRWGNPLGHQSLVDLMIVDGLWDAFYDVHMATTVEPLVRLHQLTREDQDRFALDSHQKAIRAIDAGRFADEIVPVSVKKEVVATDEHPRRDTTLDRLLSLRPAFGPGTTITAGNASGINDGAAAVVISSDVPSGSPLSAEIAGVSVVATDPMQMALAPAFAVRKILSSAGLAAEDIDLWEINEAFAGQMLAMLREFPIPKSRLNVNGGAIALGHPIGCSGARILVTLVHELTRRQVEFGIAALCVGGGLGMAVLLRNSR